MIYWLKSRKPQALAHSASLKLTYVDGPDKSHFTLICGHRKHRYIFSSTLFIRTSYFYDILKGHKARQMSYKLLKKYFPYVTHILGVLCKRLEL